MLKKIKIMLKKIKIMLKKIKIMLKKNIYLTHFLILFLGFVGCCFKYYLLTYYAVIHFFVLLGRYLSKDFKKKLDDFEEDQIIIKKHYLEDFKIWYYLVFSVRLITFSFYCYFFSLDVDSLSNFTDFFYGITYIFILVGLIDLGITFYIILYKNTPVTDMFLNLCYHGFTKGVPAMGALHISSNVPFIAPNAVSNEYHKYSPIGRGYGAWSTGQLFQVDYIKTHLGGEFNYKDIVDQNNMIEPTKLKSYVKNHNLDIKIFSKLGTTKPR
nr:hypothetical protein [Haslea karadagensis]